MWRERRDDANSHLSQLFDTTKNLQHVAEYRYLKKFHIQILAQMVKKFDLINEGSSLLKRKKL